MLGLIHDTTWMFPLKMVYYWIWAPATEVQTVLTRLPNYRQGGCITKSPEWSVLTSAVALCNCDEQQQWRSHLLVTSRILPPLIVQSHLICRMLTMRMQVTLDDKNLGWWAELMQI